MDAPEFFKRIVSLNYDEWKQNPTDLRLLWNAALSMNTVAEWVALHRSKYAQMTEGELNCNAKKIRDCSPLQKLNDEVLPLKHVRKLRGIKAHDLPLSSILSSTAYSSDAPETWKELADATDEAFKTVSQFDDLK